MKITAQAVTVWKCEKTSVLDRAWNRWLRDISMVLEPSGEAPSRFEIELIKELAEEEYWIQVHTEDITIKAGDDLGIIYALLYLSEQFLHITPFWFWNDQTFHKMPYVEVPEGEYHSPNYQLRYRGWFINDEVLLDAWGVDHFDSVSGITENEAFEMAMEALLRLGGNMVIPGTDHNSHKYKKLAADMGLWLTHHHAEPLGATMFARAYPDQTPSYKQHPDLFHSLWREAIEEQQGMKVVWNIGFRGQGDRPFWADDPEYDTPQKRGELISSLIRKQYDMLCEYIEKPICCTNLYGEVMELYQQGYINLPEHIIYIWADNGYGKMVSRRQGSHNPRVEALPPKPQGKHGIYYHASFYDLQAASHITMLPNSTLFVEQELFGAMEKGVKEFLIVNCSNIKPHTYMLDAIARIWGKEMPCYTKLYFPSHSDAVETLYQNYFQSMLSYGPNQDDHAGDQYYHYTMRAICHGWLAGRFDMPENSLVWLTGNIHLYDQVTWLHEKAKSALPSLHTYYENCLAYFEKLQKEPDSAERTLFQDSLWLQAVIHYKSLYAQKTVCEAFFHCIDGRQKEAFLAIGRAIEELCQITEAMKQASHGKWSGFYDNDCLTDVTFTIYTLERIMGYIRNLGDGPHGYNWALHCENPDTDRPVVLITNMRKHKKDWELYLLMKNSKKV